MSKWSFCKWLCFIALPMFFAVGCSKKSEVKNDNPKGLPSSGGKTLEVLVIVPERLTADTEFIAICRALSADCPRVCMK